MFPCCHKNAPDTAAQMLPCCYTKMLPCCHKMLPCCHKMLPCCQKMFPCYHRNAPLLTKKWSPATAQNSLLLPQKCSRYCRTNAPMMPQECSPHCFKFRRIFRQIDVVSRGTSANRCKYSGIFFRCMCGFFPIKFSDQRIFPTN